jgi:hypothetical protein
VVELRERARGLDPGWAAADDDDVQGAVLDQRRFAIGRFPGLQDMVLQADRVGERVQRKGMFLRSLDTEEVDLGAEPEDEVVVGQGLELTETDLARVEIDRRDRVLVNARVRLLVDEVANRVADCRLLDQPRRHLVQERLEGVVIVLVDEDDLDVALLELLRGADAREAAADDQDAGAPVTVEFCAHEVVPNVRRRLGPRIIRTG